MVPDAYQAHWAVRPGYSPFPHVLRIQYAGPWRLKEAADLLRPVIDRV